MQHQLDLEQLARIVAEKCRLTSEQVGPEVWTIWCQSHDTYIGVEGGNAICPVAYQIADKIAQAGWTPPLPVPPTDTTLEN